MSAADDDRDVAAALAALVGTIGGEAFPARFLAAMTAIAGIELCSTFRCDGSEVRLLFAQGEQVTRNGFPLRASRDYARGFWRSDAQLARMIRRRSGGPFIVRRRAEEIPDPAYRAACYDRAGVIERVSIVAPGRPVLVANGYRTARAGFLSQPEIQRFELHAALLIAALGQHRRAGMAVGGVRGEAALIERLLTLECGLSAREAEVAAALIRGDTQAGIAGAKRLSAATVVTYRRRAYAKLGVASRRDLVALNRGVSDPV